MIAMAWAPEIAGKSSVHGEKRTKTPYKHVFRSQKRLSFEETRPLKL